MIAYYLDDTTQTGLHITIYSTMASTKEGVKSACLQRSNWLYGGTWIARPIKLTRVEKAQSR